MLVVVVADTHRHGRQQRTARRTAHDNGDAGDGPVASTDNHDTIWPMAHLATPTLEPDDIAPPDEYARTREDFSAYVAALHANRIVTCTSDDNNDGASIDVIFQNRATLRFEIQERLAVIAERSGDNQHDPATVAELCDTFNLLAADAGHISALVRYSADDNVDNASGTVSLELADGERVTGREVGHVITGRLQGRRVRGIRFELDDNQILSFDSHGATLVIDHPACTYSQPLADNVAAAISADLHREM